MRIIVALFVLAAASPLVAQYSGPPPETLQDSARVLNEALRFMEKPVIAARDKASILVVVAMVQNTLVGNESAEITDAKKIIDDFLDRRERADKPLSPENMRTIVSVRQELEHASATNAPPLVLRERLHHEFVHPLQREVMRSVRELELIEQEFSHFRSRHLEFAMRDSIGAIGAALLDVKQKE
jgi:hypothetical protein